MAAVDGIQFWKLWRSLHGGDGRWNSILRTVEVDDGGGRCNSILRTVEVDDGGGRWN